MEEKKCICCNEVKPLHDYYQHKQMADKRLNKCKDCCKKQAKQKHCELSKNESWIEKEKIRSREKYYRLNYGEKYKPTTEAKSKYIKRYIDKYPEKRLATLATRKMSTKINGNHLHHWSYKEEHRKDCIELTPQQHAFIHRHIIYDQERMMYRTRDGLLLDTKEESLRYYESLIGHSLPF
jgi:hypothetical protein